MNVEADRRLRVALNKVDSLNEEITAKLSGERLSQFEQATSAWVTYMDEWAKFEADFYRGGSIWPTIYGSAAFEIAEAREKQLRRHLREYELLS